MSLPDFEIPGYKLIRPIGSGGMATVYLAVQESLGREVAIKIMRSSNDEDNTLEERFLREGQNLARLTHHHIANIYDIAQTDDCTYFAMELLEGGSLSERMREGISLTAATNVVLQIGSALNAAHRIGIVHRDLKPSNILFRDAATPVLTDFGIAKDTQAATKLTNTGMMVGTPSYMSPEQIMGREIDGRSDLYSLGVVFYEMLTGKLPFEAEEAIALAMKHIYEPVPPLDEDLGALQPVIDQVLAKNPDERYESVSSFCYALKEVIEQSPDVQLRMSGETMMFRSSDFSEPAISGKSLGPGATPRTPSGAAMPPPPPLGPASGQRPTKVARTPALLNKLTQRQWIGVGLIAAALLIVVIGVLMSRPRLDPETQQIVDALMSQADRQVSNQYFTEPPGNNAFETLRDIYSYAPEYGPADEIVEEVINNLEARARIALARNDIDLAESLLGKAEQFGRESEGLATARNLVEGAKADRDRIRQVAQLQREATELIEAGRLVDAAGDAAVDKIDQALTLDPGNADLELLRQQVRTTLLQQVEQQLEANQLAAADEQLTLVTSAFGRSPAIDQLATRLADELAAVKRAAQIQRLTGLATEQFRQQRYYAEGSGALGLYRQVLQLDPENRQAGQALVVIAAHYLSEARQLEQDQSLDESLASIELGLLADPDNADLVALQTKIETFFADRQQLIAQALQQARALIAMDRVITPEDNNARSVLTAALAEVPGHPELLELAASLPTEVGRRINNLLNDNRFTAATELATRAADAFPDQDFATMPALIAQRQAAFEQGQQFSTLISQARSALTGPTLNRLAFQRAAAALSKAGELEPDNTEAQQLLAELYRKAEARVAALVQADSLPAATAFIDEIAQVDDDYAGLDQLRGLVSDRNQALAEAERQRIAALSLPVTIDARPWGRLVGLNNLAGKQLELPADVVTPMVLPLLPGSYKAQFEHPDYQLPVDVEFRVGNGANNAVIAVFEVMKAEEYFAGVKF